MKNFYDQWRRRGTDGYIDFGDGGVEHVSGGEVGGQGRMSINFKKHDLTNVLKNVKAIFAIMFQPLCFVFHHMFTTMFATMFTLYV